jgi:hypothetical protein
MKKLRLKLVNFGQKFNPGMVYSTKFILQLFLLILLFRPASAQDSIPHEFCISQDEFKLYELINEYRKKMNLSEIPLSNSLSYVAKTHAMDLAENRPDTGTCNFHSWSDKGKWKPCCFVREVKDRSCMLNKPSEFTLYPGPAFELVYWESREANAARAFDQWSETTVSRSMMTNLKEWENRKWNALGIGIYKGFAIAWLGEKVDVENQIAICETGEIIKNKPAPVVSTEPIVNLETNRFYLIVAGFTSFDQAKTRLKKFHDQGYKEARIISKDDRYRVSISDYGSMEEADKAKREFASKYKDAWVLAF